MRNELIPKVLKEYRKQNNYSVNDVALLLHERSFDVAAKTIYGWESGQAQPSADILLTLCEIYKVADILSAFGYNTEEDIAISPQEQALILAYRKHPEMHNAVHILLGIASADDEKQVGNR